MPVGSSEQWLIIIGWWEVVIGIIFLFRSTTRIAITLLLLEMVGTFMPLVFLLEVNFQKHHFLMPTLEGQYIIKNLMVISATLVLGGTFYKKRSAQFICHSALDAEYIYYFLVNPYIPSRAQE